jgi:hypothetical protein
MREYDHIIDQEKILVDHLTRIRRGAFEREESEMFLQSRWPQDYINDHRID